MSTLHSIDDFLNIIKSQVRLLGGRESLPLHKCLNRVSAEPLLAPFDLPETETSAMDGYALLAADSKAQEVFRVSQKIMADSVAEPLEGGTAARIFTGGMLPKGADCVVIQENCQSENDQIRLDGQAISGQNVRPAASNFAKGQELFPSDSIINTPRLALAAMAGQTQISVKPCIKASVLAIGDELVAPGEQLAEGKIYDSNSAMITNLLQQLGCVVETHTIGDDAEQILSTIAAASERSDLLVSCGGASVGDRDHVAKIIADAGELHAWKASIKPGKPIIFGSIMSLNRKVPFFGLPGNPSSSMVTCAIFVRSAIRNMLAINEPEVTPYTLPAANSYQNRGDRDQFVYCQRGSDGIKICDQQNSASLFSASMATGMCRIRAKQKVSTGDFVDYYPFTEMFSL